MRPAILATMLIASLTVSQPTESHYRSFCALCTAMNTLSLGTLLWSLNLYAENYFTCHQQWPQRITHHSLPFSLSSPKHLATGVNQFVPLSRSLYASVFHFSNEWNLWHGGFDKTIQQLESADPQVTKNVRVAILIGHSSYHALLPALSRHSDLVIFLDLSAPQLDWIRHGLSTLKQSRFNKEQEYQEALQNGTDFPPELFKQDYQLDRRFSGNYHPWSSAKRHRQTLKALNRLQFAFVEGDIADTHLIRRLAIRLKESGAQVTYMNISNVMEWLESPARKRAVKNMSLLPGISSSFFSYSVMISGQFLGHYASVQPSYSATHLLKEYQCLKGEG